MQKACKPLQCPNKVAGLQELVFCLAGSCVHAFSQKTSSLGFVHLSKHRKLTISVIKLEQVALYSLSMKKELDLMLRKVGELSLATSMTKRLTKAFDQSLLKLLVNAMYVSPRQHSGNVYQVQPTTVIFI
jgi:hypothetical protein